MAFLGAKCVKCGRLERWSLEVDHVNGDGAKDRRRGGNTAVYQRVMIHPEDYQVLCVLCNRYKAICEGNFGPGTGHNNVSRKPMRGAQMDLFE